MEIVFVYQKKRKEFGRHSNFGDRPAELSIDIAPDVGYNKNFVERNPCFAEIQTAADKSEHEVNISN